MPSAANKASAFRFLLRFKRSRSSMYRAPRFERGGCRRESCRECQFAGMWLNPNSRGSRLRIWQPWGCKSLHAHHLTAPGLRGNSRPQRLKIAEPSGCKSRGADRRVVNRE